MRHLAFITALLWLSGLSYAMTDPAPVEITVVSVQASNKGTPHKTFSKGLEKVKSAIASLSYDTFEKIGSSNAVILFGEKTTFYINQRYSLVVEPTSIDDQGRIRLKTQILMQSKKDSDPVKALDTVLVMAPGKHLNLGGLKLTDGDLIVVMKVK